MRIAVLGPGGVGGLMAAVLSRSGTDVTAIARQSTARAIATQGLRVRSVTFGDFTARVSARERLTHEVDALVVATKAASLERALARIGAAPKLVLPLLNGLDHLAVLRARFSARAVLAGAIRVESDRPEPGVVVHTSPFLLVDMATHDEASRAGMEALANALSVAEVPVRVRPETSARAEAEVMWAKLVRLNALACTTSAYDTLLGEIRSTPELYADLTTSIEEASVVARAEGAQAIEAATAIAELDLAHATLGSSMQRDIAAGRTPEVDAIPGAVLRAAARHGLRCPTIERLTIMIAARAGIPAPLA